jgi:hypothetical protein
MINWTEVTAVATSMAALGAIIAAIFAGRAFARQREQLQLLQRQEQERQNDRRMAQASLVSAWLESEDLSRDTGHIKVRVIMHNGSTEPVSQCTIIVRKGSETDPIGEGTDWVPVLRPLTDIERLIEFDLPEEINRPLVDITVQDAVGKNWGRGSSVELVFHDAAMRKWRRSDDELREISPKGGS